MVLGHELLTKCQGQVQSLFVVIAQLLKFMKLIYVVCKIVICKSSKSATYFFIFFLLNFILLIISVFKFELVYLLLGYWGEKKFPMGVAVFALWPSSYAPHPRLICEIPNQNRIFPLLPRLNDGTFNLIWLTRVTFNFSALEWANSPSSVFVYLLYATCSVHQSLAGQSLNWYWPNIVWITRLSRWNSERYEINAEERKK